MDGNTKVKIIHEYQGGKGRSKISAVRDYMPYFYSVQSFPQAHMPHSLSVQSLLHWRQEPASTPESFCCCGWDVGAGLCCDLCLLIQWYSRTPAKTPTTNAIVPVTTTAIPVVTPAVLRIVGVMSVLGVVCVMTPEENEFFRKKKKKTIFTNHSIATSESLKVSV